MKNRSKLVLLGSSLTLFMAVVGCGGSSSTTTTPTVTTTTSKVTGTVPGTLIEVLCRDGSYYKVNSTDDGTTEHPFSIDLPKNVDCKFIMTTNEKDVDTSRHIVTPILFKNGNTTSSYFKLTDDVSIGYVPLSLTATGVQTPLIVENQELEVNTYTTDPLDNDNDGVPNIYEDDDNDGIVNVYDEDDDGDGILDTIDSDYANDNDGDGVDNRYDVDDDNDELEDSKDDDDDNDGIKDVDDDDHEDDTPSTNTTTNILLPVTFKADAGRLLGSQCAQCHGTNGVSVNSWDSIAGENNLASEFFEDEEPIMTVQAHGYSSAEVTLIGNWLKTLSKNASDNDNDDNDDNDNDDNDNDDNDDNDNDDDD